jgi:DNA-binding GntR family transcriptional regulator
MKGPPVKSYSQIWQAIAADIKENILNGRYKPEERLKESELAAKYQVSKTPVREALRYLENMGFVEIVPHTMACVKRMSQKEVENLYSIQSVLEGLAVRKAITYLQEEHIQSLKRFAALLEKHYKNRNLSEYEKANIQFHALFWKVADNENLYQLTDNIRSRLQRFRTATRRYPEEFEELVADHQRIIDVAIKKDAEEAERLVRRHLERNGEIIIGLLKKEKIF